MKELIEKLNKLCEMDVAQSFRDEIASRDAAERAEYEQERDKAQAEVDTAIKNGWDPKYRQETVDKYAKWLGSRSGAKQILEYIYERTNIDLQNGGIREIETPTTSKELNKIVGEFPVILKMKNSFVIVSRSKYDNRIDAYFVGGSNRWNKKAGGDYFTQEIYSNGKVLDLSKPNSLSKAVNNGLVEKAWEVYGPSTVEKKNARYHAAKDNKDQLRAETGWHDRDKSGYIKRDLKQELANAQQSMRQGQYDKMKEAARAAKKLVFQKIKDGTVEDISNEDLRYILDRLESIEGAYINTYRDVDGQRQDQAKVKATLDALTNFVNEL